VIWSAEARKRTEGSDGPPKLFNWERKLFGIGQGNCNVTVLQAANAMAVIARGGIYKNPRLFLSESDVFNERQDDIGISDWTLSVVRDGMSAVVSERGGTAYSAFERSDLDTRDVRVFGKTGSTEGVVNAWFAGFAEDSISRAISIVIVVQGGESGGRDASPLAEGIIRICNEAGYIGKKPILQEGQVISAEGM